MRTARDIAAAFVVLACSTAALFPVGPVAGKPVPSTLSPSHFEFAGYPGDTLHGAIAFSNNSAGPLEVRLEPADFAPLGEDGHVTLAPSPHPENSLKDWIVPKFSGQQVGAGASVDLPFAIYVPADARSGARWGAVLVRADPAAGAGQTVSLIPLVLLNVQGAASERVAIESFTVPRFLDAPPVPLTVRFRNDGELYVKPKATVEILDMFGHPVARLSLPTENVLPGWRRRVELKAAEGLRFGRYTATLVASYGSQAQELRATAVFWIVPRRTCVIALSAFAAALLVVVVRGGLASKRS